MPRWFKLFALASLPLLGTEPLTASGRVLAPAGWKTAPPSIPGKAATEPVRRTGRVLDERTGKPVAGALVWPREEPGAFARTDANGSYALSWRPRGDLRLAATAALYFPSGETQGGPDFRLSPAAAVAGLVVDPGGRPVDGVEIEIAPAGPARPGEGLRTRGDAKGRFSVARLDPSKAWELRVLRRGFLPSTVALADLKPLSVRSDLRIVLRPGRAASGVVVDEAGHPVKGAEVTLLATEGVRREDLAPRGEEVARAAADVQGRFRIETAPAPRVDLEARAPGFAPTLVRGLDLAAGPGAFDLGRVVLTAGAVLEGQVEDPGGNPVDGAAVRVLQVDPVADRLARAGSPAAALEAVSGADGRFEVRGLKPGETVGLAVTREGYAPRTLSGLRVPAGEPARVVLSRAARLSGRIAGESGEPVAGARVVLRGLDGARPIAGLGSADGEGRFTLEGIAPGRYALDASAPGYLPGSLEKLEAAGGAEVDDLDVTLRRGATVEGTVYAPDGTPAAGATVRALPASGNDTGMLTFLPETRTDAEGHYRLGGLRPGRQSLAAEHPDYARTAKAVEIGGEETRIDLHLGSSWEVSGRAVDASGRGIAGARIELISAADASSHETLSGPDGGFRFAGIGAGNHRLRAEKPGYAQPREREIQVSGGPLGGIEVRFGRSGAVTGQILGLGFQDLARVQVAAARTGIPGEQTGRTDYQGRFRVDDLAPGDWLLLARLPDGRLARGQVTVPEAGEAALDLEFGRD